MPQMREERSLVALLYLARVKDVESTLTYCSQACGH